ncbi:hypothetical protein JL09_g5975 [Pichia kudriavzevii]|uniref:Uncharacterized protein n=1 Tax=Pichia kudriavzevii TaxID=4909 RepID=A0A099NSM7_PICKU|nr:hypothetical protein JL09_g5975 [Pichia kudriavzevii]
MDRNSSRKLAY